VSAIFMVPFIVTTGSGGENTAHVFARVRAS